MNVFLTYAFAVRSLYSTGSGEAVTYWDVSSSPVVWLHWSSTSPGVFFAVDTSPSVHVFNLLKSDKGAVASQFLDSTMKDITGVACSDTSRRGLKTLLAFSSKSSGAVCVLNVA